MLALLALVLAGFGHGAGMVKAMARDNPFPSAGTAAAVTAPEGHRVAAGSATARVADGPGPLNPESTACALHTACAILLPRAGSQPLSAPQSRRPLVPAGTAARDRNESPPLRPPIR